MLTVEKLQAAYGAARVLFDVTLSVGEGEVVTLLGRNGMGKTTTISAIMGLLRVSGGSIMFGDARLNGLPPYRVAQAGLGLVPEGRHIFPTLNVEENLIATAAARFGQPRWRLDDIYRLFPVLAERLKQIPTNSLRPNRRAGVSREHLCPLSGCFEQVQRSKPIRS